MTQRSSRCGRRVRRNVFFKFCPLLALLLSTRRRCSARRQSTAAVFHGIRSLFSRRSMHPLPVDCRGGRAVTVAHHVSIFASFRLDFRPGGIVRCCGNSFAATVPGFCLLVIEQPEQTDLFCFWFPLENAGKRHRTPSRRSLVPVPDKGRALRVWSQRVAYGRPVASLAASRSASVASEVAKAF